MLEARSAKRESAAKRSWLRVSWDVVVVVDMLWVRLVVRLRERKYKWE